jgi:hypothetical protein
VSQNREKKAKQNDKNKVLKNKKKYKITAQKEECNKCIISHQSGNGLALTQVWSPLKV